MKIAFFDSGIGGLTVFYEALRLFPNEDYLYFSDAKYAPYGGRSQEEVKELIANAIHFLAHQEVDIVVLACHTASKLMRAELEAKYDFPIIGMETGLDATHFQQRDKKVLICGTDLSIKVWENHLQSYPICADYLSLQKLVLFAENRQFFMPEIFQYLYQQLNGFAWENYQAILLGCTHFPFFKSQIQDILPAHIQILDGGYATIQKLSNYIRKSNRKQQNTIQYFISGKPKPVAFFSNYVEALKLEKERAGTQRLMASSVW